MSEPIPNLMESSIRIAWDYLDQTEELGEPEIVARVLLDTVENMINRGLQAVQE